MLRAESELMGLEISDSELRLVWIERGEIKKIFVKLPPGVLFNGKIGDADKFRLALKNLRDQFSFNSGTRGLDMVVSALIGQCSFKLIAVPTSSIQDVCVHPRSHPRLSASIRHQGGSTRITTRIYADIYNFIIQNPSLLPFDLNSNYYFVKKLRKKDEHKTKFLVAWTNKHLVEELKRFLSEANFNVVDFEFPPISLARAMQANLPAPYSGLCFYVTPDGILFIKLTEGELMDFQFYSLAVIQEEIHSHQITSQRLKNFLDEKLLLFNPLGLKVVDLSKEKWLIALGAALKLETLGLPEGAGLMSRLVKIASYASVVILPVFIIFDLFLLGTNLALDRIIEKNSFLPAITEVAELKQKDQEFKKLTSWAARVEDTRPLTILKKIKQIGGQKITLKRILIDQEQNVFVSGAAVNEKRIIDFKDRLVEAEEFREVVLPLSSLQENGNGGVAFSLSFKAK